MTPDEAKESLGEIIKIKAPGRGKGFLEVEVYDIDVKEKTPWGRGSIKFIDIENPKKRKVACCLTQIELYKEIDGNSTGRRWRARKKADSTQTASFRKRQRNSKGRRRRRS